MGNTMIWTLPLIRSANRAAGGKFFENAYGPSFHSSVVSRVIQGAGGVYFVTRDVDQVSGCLETVFRLWQFHPERGRIDLAAMDAEEGCDVWPYSERTAAMKRAKTLAQGAE
jgi:hypothetical protein